MRVQHGEYLDHRGAHRGGDEVVEGADLAVGEVANGEVPEHVVRLGPVSEELA